MYTVQVTLLVSCVFYLLVQYCTYKYWSVWHFELYILLQRPEVPRRTGYSELRNSLKDFKSLQNAKSCKNSTERLCKISTQRKQKSLQQFMLCSSLIQYLYCIYSTCTVLPMTA